jgi:hypothetical protein
MQAEEAVARQSASHALSMTGIRSRSNRLLSVTEMENA